MFKKRGLEDSEEINHSLLRKAMKQRISYILSKPNTNEKEVYTLIKDFFKNLLKLDYEFTHEELIEELEKTYLDYDIHEKLVNFIKEVGKIEYSDKKYTREELVNYIKQLEIFVKVLLSAEHREKIKTHHIFKKETYEKLEHTENGFLREKFEEVQYHLTTRDLKSAKKIYAEIMEKYEKLPKEEKEKYYDLIQEIYKAITKFSLN